MKAIVTIGVSASGKTTWAKEQQGYEVVCRDDVRRNILTRVLRRPLEPGELWKKWKWKDEDKVTDIVNDLLQHSADMGKNVIVADTNLNNHYRTKLIEQLDALGYEVETKVFNVSFEEACKRDAGRADGVGHSVLMKQWMQFNAEFGYQPYVANKSLPKAVVCDIDGTLAHMTGRGAFEWHRVGEDDVDEIVRNIISSMLYEDNYQVILLSGRDSVCRAETKDWLDRNDVKYHELFMRAKDDSRKDVDVKYELFNTHIRNNYNVKCVIDDRPQVVRLWQALGLKTITMGNPFIEF